MSNDRYSGQRECGCGRICPIGQPCQCGRWNEVSKLPRFRPTIRDPEPDWEAEAKRLQAEVERLTAELAIATAIGEANRGETVAMYGTVDAVFPDVPPESPCTCRRKLDGPPTEEGWYWQVSTNRIYPTMCREIRRADIDAGWAGELPNGVTLYGPICEPKNDEVTG